MKLIKNKNNSIFEGARAVGWVEPSQLTIAPWRTTYIIKTDLEVLLRSMEDYGWLQPLVVQASTGIIIDGNYRFEIASHLSKLNKATNGQIPVILVDCDEIDAMVMHSRLNRGRGNVLAKRLSRIVQNVLRSKKYGEPDIKRMLAMHSDEMDMMVDGTLLKDKKISEHKYSNAWVPIEAPASAKEQSIVIERPRNADG
jgi:hypothetical protein